MPGAWNSISVCMGLVVVVCAVGPAAAQRSWDDRARVNIGGGAQLGTNRLSESISLTKNVEATPLTADLQKSAVPFFDGGVDFRLVGNLGVGAAVSFLTGKADANVSAAIPHPFFFNKARTITGQAQQVLHSETAVHTDAVYLVVSPQVDLALYGGASFFRVKQDFVTDVLYGETYPFDTAAFVGARLTRLSNSAVGFNAGADVTWKLGPGWGVGGLLRFSRARVPFSTGGIDFGRADAGGVQAGGGLRLRF